MRRHSPALLAIIGYKSLTALVLLALAITMLVVVRKHLALEDWVDQMTLTGQHIFIAGLAEHVLQVKPRTLAFGSVVAGLYSGVSLVEALGLWHQKVWAHWLVLGAIGMGLFPELYELTKGISPLKVLILLLNIAILAYLIRNPVSHKR